MRHYTSLNEKRRATMATYGKKAQETVKEVMEEFKEGALKEDTVPLMGAHGS